MADESVSKIDKESVLKKILLGFLLVAAGCSTVPSTKFISTDEFQKDAYQACIHSLGKDAKMSASSLQSYCRHEGRSGLNYAEFQYKMNLADQDFNDCQKLPENGRDKCFINKQRAFYQRAVKMMGEIK